MNGDSYSARGLSPTPSCVSHATTVGNISVTDVAGSLEAGVDGRRGRDYPAWQPNRGDRDERRDRFRDRNRERERDRDRDRDRQRERRRSRSPDNRHRRGDGDADAYSSSRTHRDREREDRYAGRDRRGEREWDRDRGSSRRDSRRDDEERTPRRDRDLYDDRRRGPRERRDEPAFARQEPRRSPTPVKREPTPDLTDIVSILERKRRLTQWDIKPPGYELVTAEQAKLSGMFALPGAPRQQAVDPTRIQAFMNQPGAQVTSAGLKANNSRQSKRLIVSNLPPQTTDETLVSFFNLQLNGLNVIESPDPCAYCQLSTDSSFAVLEFRNASDATMALALDGISMTANDTANGSDGPDASGLVIQRPKDYVMPAVPDETLYDLDTISNIVPDTVHKLCISNLPTYLTEEQVMELLAAFGKLKAFVLVKDRNAEESRGIAFAEYHEPAAANEAALNTLNAMDVRGNKLKVTKASFGFTQVANFDVGITAISGLASQTSGNVEKGRVLQLLNMVKPDELMDNDEYQEICDDVREECAKFGTLLDLKVPRPSGGSRQSAGVGKIFVKFESSEAAQRALTALAGRKFADRTVVVTYFPEENFEVNAW